MASSGRAVEGTATAARLGRAHALHRLPDHQLAPLAAAYATHTRALRRQVLVGVSIALLCAALAAHVAEVDPHILYEKIGGFTSYVDRILKLDSGARVWTNVGDWYWGWKRWLGLLGDTILISYLGTALGTGGALLITFGASANLGRNRLLRFGILRLFEFCRTVPDLVFALIFVVAFGLGPLPGVLALAIHSTGALGKQFTEVVENIDMKPVDGVEASGGGFVSMVRFAVLPQIAPNIVSYALLRFEINVRAATVMGFVGAGGIGEDLLEAIRKFYYSDVSAIVAMLILTVFVIDIATGHVRRRLTSREGHA